MACQPSSACTTFITPTTLSPIGWSRWHIRLLRYAAGQRNQPEHHDSPLAAKFCNCSRGVHAFCDCCELAEHACGVRALAFAQVQRAAFVPVFGAGKRLHIAAQEFTEDVGSAASRIGSTLAGALSFVRNM